MNYNDIKDKLVGTTNNLSAIPIQVMLQLLPEQWYDLITASDSSEMLPHIEHPDITTTTHYQGYLEGNKYPYRICSVLMEGVPAFFFVHLIAGESMIDVHVLNLYQTRCVLRSIMELAVDMLDEHSLYFADEVTADKEVHVYDRIISAISRTTEPDKYEYW